MFSHARLHQLPTLQPRLDGDNDLKLYSTYLLVPFSAAKAAHPTDLGYWYCIGGSVGVHGYDICVSDDR